MIKIKVEKDIISINGHANFDDYGKDIVCAAVSSIVMTSIEGIATFDQMAVDIQEETYKLIIIINKHDDITNKLIANMLKCIQEVANKYPQNIKIIYREE